MLLPLSLHRDYDCPPVQAVTVNVARSENNIVTLDYHIAGNINDVALPPIASPTRGDKLWEHSCFEIFIRVPGCQNYIEFNFAPSAAWAAYSFVSHRKGMQIASSIEAPLTDSIYSDDHYCMMVTLPLNDFADLGDATIWEIGLSAVIEQVSGACSYWALAHPIGQADFHHDDCFAYHLEATTL